VWYWNGWTRQRLIEEYYRLCHEADLLDRQILRLYVEIQNRKGGDDECQTTLFDT